MLDGVPSDDINDNIKEIERLKEQPKEKITNSQEGLTQEFRFNQLHQKYLLWHQSQPHNQMNLMNHKRILLQLGFLKCKQMVYDMVSPDFDGTLTAENINTIAEIWQGDRGGEAMKPSDEADLEEVELKPWGEADRGGDEVTEIVEERRSNPKTEKGAFKETG
ncbi:hypothetical protein L1987_15150 [Smallanthus sonchifolius]|uniref:Uncharacterized protein n=1 Tax=Smallanthus sonchifolius TaxID=185202 RepID=A0ACB9J5S8_9ASTR|nr:hypothetical protein L1987_15150 [Smallanthus sonchifolius]